MFLLIFETVFSHESTFFSPTTTLFDDFSQKNNRYVLKKLYTTEWYSPHLLCWIPIESPQMFSEWWTFLYWQIFIVFSNFSTHFTYTLETLKKSDMKPKIRRCLQLFIVDQMFAHAIRRFDYLICTKVIRHQLTHQRKIIFLNVMKS